MDHDQVVTFFHEFGHLMHHVLGGHQKWITFSGVATEWDFVEAPSQFFEEWAWDVGVLQRFALHFETGEPIPADLVARMRAAEEFGKGVNTRGQMFYAALSLNYYSKDPSSFNALELLKELQLKYSKFPYVENTHFNLNFGHLDGYSAIYYTYMWSQVIAKDLLTPFKKNGLMSHADAKRYRQTVLEAGGSKDAAELVQDFLGRPYNFDAFKQWLESEAVPNPS
jgi:thimet oligopeptidase